VTADAAQEHLGRNFWLGVVSGIGYNLYQTVANPGLVMTWFVSELTRSNLLISLLMPLDQGGWYLPQLLLSGYLQRLPRTLPVYRIAGAVRSGAMGLLALSIFVLEDPAWLLAAFFGLFAVNSLAAGVAGLPFMDVVAKAIPPTRRGALFGWRRFLGGLLGLAGGALVKVVLAPDFGLHFPDNYGLLFALAFLFVSLMVGSFSLIVEPTEEAVDARPVRLGQQLRRAVQLPAQHRSYGRFLALRLTVIAANYALPFYAVYARRALDAPEDRVGVYLIGSTLAGVLSNLIWGQMGDRRGNRLLMRWATLLAVLAPATAMLIARLPQTAWDKSQVFTLVFVFSGAHQTAAFIGNGNYLLEMAPPGERAMYIGFTNTVMGAAIFASPLGGAIVDLLGFEALFLFSLICSAAAVFLALGLEEPRERPVARGVERPTSGGI
jgi:predicted MFS family arabinose efflux permease